MAAAPIYVPAIVAGVGIAVSAREAQLSREQARDAMNQPKPAQIQKPKGIVDSADSLAKANLLSQQAGGSLLSDPTADRASGKQIGSVPASGKSLLGS